MAGDIGVAILPATRVDRVHGRSTEASLQAMPNQGTGGSQLYSYQR